MHNLPAPNTYTPFDTGHYAFNVGLSPLTRKFGNGESDNLLFQLDDQFQDYRANKQLLRDNLSLYSGIHETCDPKIMQFTCETIAHNLLRAYPDLFHLTSTTNEHTLDCTLTADHLTFNKNWELLGGFTYTSALDALASQIQEDIAIIHLPDPYKDQLVACHICAPSGWNPSNKIGKSFQEIHAPIPEMDSIKEASQTMLFNLTRPGAHQRFVWSITFDDILNRHPTVMTPERTAPFNPNTGQVFARVERQVIWGMAEISSFLFTIRTYIYPVREMAPELQIKLKQAILSQTPLMLKYKGIENSIDAITEWFDRSL